MEKEKKVDVLKITDDYKPFKKPASDFYRLDVVKRETVKTDRGYTVMLEDIKVNYREYLKEASYKEQISIAEYLQKLIDADMKAHNYKPKTEKKS